MWAPSSTQLPTRWQPWAAGRLRERRTPSAGASWPLCWTPSERARLRIDGGLELDRGRAAPGSRPTPYRGAIHPEDTRGLREVVSGSFQDLGDVPVRHFSHRGDASIRRMSNTRESGTSSMPTAGARSRNSPSRTQSFGARGRRGARRAGRGDQTEAPGTASGRAPAGPRARYIFAKHGPSATIAPMSILRACGGSRSPIQK
jgi:hypothetical protein